MAESIEHYRDYELAFYWKGRGKVAVQIRAATNPPYAQ